LLGDLTRDDAVIEVQINGVAHQVDAPAEMPLLWVLRDLVGLTGTKFGCGIGACGACTVHVDGAAQRACQLPIGDVKGKVTTIEGLGGQALHPVQKAWIADNVPQCGYCQSGMIMAAADLLKTKPKPTDTDIDEMISNICRCGTYRRIKSAIHAAAGQAA
jgi:isoquinoline 1-oxidoreductase alpha subunit